MKEKINVLVVEDEFLVAADIEESLISLGYNVQNTVATGQGAIDEVEKKLPDVILMDIMLKGNMTGIQASKIIQQKHNVPIIYLTANADIATVEKAKVSLPYGYILKPFTDKELQTNIEIARYKFESDLKYKMESDQYKRFFRIGDEDKSEIIIEGESGLEKMKIDDIYLVENDGDSSYIFLADETILAKVPATYIESKLPDDIFVRISKKHIINVTKIFLLKLPEIIISDLMNVVTVEDEYLDALNSKI